MLIALAKADGSLPPALASRPVLTSWQQGFYDAFQTLSSSRNYTSASAAAIPYPYLLQWLNEHRIYDLSDREEFVNILQAIDQSYLEIVNKPTK